MAEAMAAKLPVGRHAPTSLVAHELAALATWCLAGEAPDEMRLLTPAAGLWCSQRYRALRGGLPRPGAAGLDPGLAAGLGSLPLERHGWQWVLGHARGSIPS